MHFDVSERTSRRRDAACTFHLRFGSRVDGTAMKASASVSETGRHTYMSTMRAGARHARVFAGAWDGEKEEGTTRVVCKFNCWT
jgi:hypothetical protein